MITAPVLATFAAFSLIIILAMIFQKYPLPKEGMMFKFEGFTYEIVGVYTYGFFAVKEGNASYFTIEAFVKMQKSGELTII